MIIKDSDEKVLKHYGILRRSGRYPWGSGSTENVRNKGFLDYVDNLKSQGLSEKEIADGVGISIADLRAARSIASNQQKQAKITQAVRYKDKGMSNVAIGTRMGINESSVRALLSASQKEAKDILQTVANTLREHVLRKGAIDVGSGVENHLGIAATKLATAVAMLKEEGFKTHNVKVTQAATGKQTTIKVLATAETKWSDLVRDPSKIKLISDFSQDQGRSFLGLLPPISISSKRLAITYAEDGGAKADGVIYVRPGVDDISMGKSRYAQVRIAIDGTHYLKGMAIYKDDLPKGVDLLFNTNKSKAELGNNKLAALKELKKDPSNPDSIDPDNPFGSVVSQIFKTDEHGNQREELGVSSAMNIVNEQGDWEKWKKTISSQVLSKQSPSLAKTQLDMTYERNREQLDEILSLTNPAVRKTLLDAYADSMDSSSVHLKAAALPRQRSHVILPVPEMKETEIYAPNYNNGERVALIRYPHGGKFEIPELTVNNRQPAAKGLIGKTTDAVGIHPKVAERLSGADFDGDTVLVIPNSSGKIKTAAALDGLKGFDPQREYPGYEGMPKMSPHTKQTEMGKVSNLITDMTIKGANNAELARAVRHSMVVIDAEKHNLDYKQSYINNGILQLKQKYQAKPDSTRTGASTIISRAKSRQDVPERKQGFRVDKTTGEKIFIPTGRTTVDKQGNTILKTQRSTQLAEAKDANVLSSGTPMERLYAAHSNKLKALANTARRESVNTKAAPYSPSAKEAYKTEVDSLNAKLNVALKNRPLERHAQALTASVVSAKTRANPAMDSAELKKIRYQALAEARTRTGADKQQVKITKDEWDAIQAGAISHSKLSDILKNADLDVVKELATPKEALLMSPTKVSRAKSMEASGYTQAEIATALGVSLTTLKEGLK